MRSHGIHHIHRRKRVYQKLEPYPHPNKWIRFFDSFLIAVAVINPFIALPQIYGVYVEKNVSGVSAITWFLGGIFSVPWLIYGIVHRVKSHMVLYTLWIVFDMSIAIGVLIHS